MISGLTVSLKIYLGFLVAIAGTVIVAISGFVGISSISRNAGVVYDSVARPSFAITALRRSIANARIDLRDILNTDSPEQKAKLKESAVGFLKEAEEYRRDMNRLVLTEDLKVAIDKYDRVLIPFLEIVTKIAGHLDKQEIDSARYYLVVECRPRAGKVISSLDEMIRVQSERGAAIKEHAEEQTSLTTRTFVAVSLAFVGLSLVLALVVNRAVIPPLRSLAETAQRLSNGDLAARSSVTGKDELGKVASTFNAMASRLQGVIQEAQENEQYLRRALSTLMEGMRQFAQGNLRLRLEHDRHDIVGELYQSFNQSVEQIDLIVDRVQEMVLHATEASEMISHSAAVLAEGVRAQTQQIEEVAQGVEHMSHTINSNAQGTAETASAAHRNGDIATQSAEVIGNTVEKMREIATVVQKTSTNVEELGKASSHIGEIVSTIRDIADQTNLLALNAAIEAARAGEQGRGFAVVADEVRRLAERTTQATKEVESMIRGIQAQTKSAVEFIALGNLRVEEGLSFADSAGRSLEEITSSALIVVDRVGQIAKATEEQVSTSERFSESVSMISHLSMESTSKIETIAQTTDNIYYQMRELKDAVSQFETSGQGSEPPRVKRNNGQLHPDKRKPLLSARSV